ncbi:MAG: asparagine synthase (glutamine-hydrolyzing) [Verrucomicrobiota bacterium]
MCAICGIINFHDPVVSPEKVVQMRDVMVNRGPEHGGLQVMPHAGLGHRRLRIIDLSADGNQPMTNETGDVWVVFNGEIYNFQGLREELRAKGHVFKSRSDTEVIIHGYEEWGAKVFARLDGMFAIGLWDARERKLLLARDRFGKKPLYYREAAGHVHFASDIKALWLAADRKLEVDAQAIDCYLHHLGVPQQHAVFKGVAKVLPAHWMEFKNGAVRNECYWKLSFQPKLKLSEAELIEAVDDHLRQAVKRRLISDVPLGAFLSGGVDSSMVVAMMSKESNAACRTFSIGFDEADYSELQYSRKVAQLFGTDHQEIMLQPDVTRDLASLVWEYGEPFADSSAIPTYYVSKAAKAHVTVALTGDGGDEMFGGYDIARAAYYAAYYARLKPEFLRSWADDWLLGGSALVENSRFLHRLKTLAVRANARPDIRYYYSMAFNPAQRREAYHPDFAARVGAHNHHHIFEGCQADLKGLHLIDQYLLTTIISRLPNDYLVKTDVASMKSALELRSPFLDTALAEFAAQIDPLVKVRGGQQKYLLKKLAERYLPHEVLYRKKRGFAIPLEHWLRKQFLPLLNRMLPEGWLVQNHWFRREVLVQYIQEHASGKRDHTHRLWAALWLELWCRMFLAGTLQKDDDLSG